VVDCAALPETLVESVLFGHAKGAFTGADRNKTGLIFQAHGGTLFLDEIGELPLSLQKSFLRVLQEHRFRPVGGKQEQYSDFRLVAATLRNLDQMSEKEEFRQDLLFRVRSFSIHIPPLRERPEDIKELTSHYLGKLCDRYKMGIKGCSSGFLEDISTYTWPGNARELINALETTVTSASYEETLYSKHLPDEIRIHLARNSFESVEPDKKNVNYTKIDRELPSIKKFRKAAADEAEKTYLKYLFEKVGNDLKSACSISGLSRSRFYEMLKKHKMSLPG
jgi:two-component system NtrC family response regulator